ncbi:VWA domain-containing protein [Endozoicomonas sp. SM1973]|uniref:VWA domain-containing protein n=1 Tax=Spartinivicinus marinus TaxID=2994442 RepID=A0A853I787_9GAMM|nr:VWA domain-containing protein [Spartinivicinus marinus]MCX4024839.1 VWA domain-containing protein [Spartinivicinus marinus]NYZ66518.1 VWA domain-containing protein [Spartinivicinus marinus]
MEEWVGSLWHRFITRQSIDEFTSVQVSLVEVKRSVGVLFRALGGEPGKRIEPATPRAYQQRRRLIQQIAGTCLQTCVAWQDDESLRLPPTIAVFPTAELNRSLYLWLTALAAHQKQPFRHWAWDNQQLVQQLLVRYPGLNSLYQQLIKALLPLRPPIDRLSVIEAALEQAVQTALQQPGSVETFPRCNVAPQPIPVWLYPSANLHVSCQPSPQEPSIETIASSESPPQQLAVRKRAERINDANERDGLLVFRLENLFSWAEYSHLNRCSDEGDDDQAKRVADDLNCLAIAQQRPARSAQLRVDLDLPAASQDDIPIGDGILLPEWDFRRQQLVPNQCRIQPMLPKLATAAELPKKLVKTANTLRAHFERFRTLRHWQRHLPQGEELDLAAWLDFYIEAQHAQSPEQGCYQSYRHHQRDLCCLLLADLSMSTDAYLQQHGRVIDVIQDSLLLFAEALQAVGDPFAMYGFSSVKRQQVRLLMLKNFQEQYNHQVRGRVLALQPGYYTRMGAAIRQMTKVLAAQPESKRLLLLISDGKPNDIDHYEGRFGIEDTREAIREAKRQQIKPFCITIDQQAADYLSYIFGVDGFTVIRQPRQLPHQLPQLYQQLTG